MKSFTRSFAVLFAVAVCCLGSAQKALDARGVFKSASSSVVRIVTPHSVGSGFAIYGGKFIVTCRHVIDRKSDTDAAGDWTPLVTPFQIEVDGVPCVAVVADDWILDVAILQLAQPRKSALSLRTDQAGPGERAYVIGFPLGIEEHTITEGLVSAVRKIPVAVSELGSDLAEFVQTTAAISEGSSGSPLLDDRGRVMGMVQASYKEGQQNNIALSVRAIRRVIDQAIESSKKPIASTKTKTASSKSTPTTTRVVLGKLGQALRETDILSKPGGSVYHTAKPFEYLVIRASDVPGFFKVLLQNGEDGYVKESDVALLPYDVTAPAGYSSDRLYDLIDSNGRALAGVSDVAAKASSMVGFDFTGVEPDSSKRTSWAFVVYLHGLLNRPIPNTIDEGLKHGKQVVRLEDLAPGDRLFFMGLKRGPANEAAIYLGGGVAVRLGGDGLVKSFNLQDADWLARLVAARR